MLQLHRVGSNIGVFRPQAGDDTLESVRVLFSPLGSHQQSAHLEVPSHYLLAFRARWVTFDFSRAENIGVFVPLPAQVWLSKY